jgi:hypothetical protein
MLDPRSFRALARLLMLGLLVALVATCGGTASGSAGTSTQTAAAPSVTGPAGGASPADGTATESPDDASETPDDGGTSAGDRTKGSAQVQVTGGVTETIDLPFAAVLSLWASSGPGSAYLPFTDSDAVLFLTFNGGQLLVQYAKSSTGVGMTSGAAPCTFTTDVLDDSNAKGTFSCKSMTLIQAETVGSADISGTFEAHK